MFLLDHHDAQLVLLVLRHLLVVVIVQLGNGTNLHAHAAPLCVLLWDLVLFIFFTFITVNLLPVAFFLFSILFLLFFLLLTVIFDPFFKFLLLWWNIVAHPPLSDEGRQVRRQGLSQGIFGLTTSPH